MGIHNHSILSTFQPNKQYLLLPWKCLSLNSLKKVENIAFCTFCILKKCSSIFFLTNNNKQRDYHENTLIQFLRGKIPNKQLLQSKINILILLRMSVCLFNRIYNSSYLRCGQINKVNTTERPQFKFKSTVDCDFSVK